MTDNNKPIVILVCGPSGSGKSTVCEKIIKILTLLNACLVLEDWYYHSLPKGKDATKHNFDEPSAIELLLLVEHIKQLINGESVEAPIYDFVSHSRIGTQTVQPRRVIIVEGILLLTCEELRNLATLMVYVDANPITCFIRRKKRDMAERGRSSDDVDRQVVQQVYPAYEQYVKPSSTYANITVHNNKDDEYTGMTWFIEYFEMKYGKK